MNSFFRRLKFYGIGFGLGLIVVLFFFQNRGCSWLPSNRVKNSFLDRVIVIPDDQLAALQKMKLDKKDIIQVLNDGEIIFTKSKKKGDPQIYRIDREFEGVTDGPLAFYFTLPKESFISEVHVTENSAFNVKNTLSGTGSIVHLPQDTTLIFAESNQKVKCGLNAIGAKNSVYIFNFLEKNGKVDFAKSHYNAQPKPDHYLFFTDAKGRKIGFSAIWYKNKVEIDAFDLPFETNCN